MNSDTIKSALESVNLDAVLSRDNAHLVFRRCYGFRSWLFAPEEGVRGLLSACLELYKKPLESTVSEIHALTIQAAKLAMKRCSKLRHHRHHTTTHPQQTIDTIHPLLLSQAMSQIEGWKKSTWHQLMRNLHAESMFPSPHHFALLKSRLQQILVKAAAKHVADKNVEYKQMLLEILKRLEASSSPVIDAASSSSSGQRPLLSTPSPHPPPPPSPTQKTVPKWNEFYMGWLEKKSRRGVWQRRWFALSVRQQKLWYFGSPEETPARGFMEISSGGIVVVQQSVEEDGRTFRVSAGAGAGIDPGGGHVGETKTKIIRHGLTLRASSASNKEEWCGWLDRAFKYTDEGEEEAEEKEAEGAVHTGLSIVSLSNGVGNAHQSGKEEGKKGPPLSIVTTDTDEGDDSSSTDTQSTSLSPSSSTSTSSTTEELTDEEKEHLRVFDEIVAQSERAKPSTEEDIAMLDCVIEAVRDYIVSSLSYLTDQMSKVVADGMLPANNGGQQQRIVQLHSALLRVVVGGGGISAGGGEYCSVHVDDANA